MKNKDKCRAAFEEWLCKEYGCNTPPSSAYSEDEMLSAEYASYRAAYNAQQEVIDELVRKVKDIGIYAQKHKNQAMFRGELENSARFRKIQDEAKIIIDNALTGC